jgi:hypothetical protein
VTSECPLIEVGMDDDWLSSPIETVAHDLDELIERSLRFMAATARGFRYWLPAE